MYSFLIILCMFMQLVKLLYMKGADGEDLCRDVSRQCYSHGSKRISKKTHERLRRHCWESIAAGARGSIFIARQRQHLPDYFEQLIRQAGEK